VSTLVSPELEEQTIAWRRQLHANPELSFEEHETTEFIRDALAEIGGLEVERPTATGVVARLRGARPGRTLALRADIDALPITEETGLASSSRRGSWTGSTWSSARISSPPSMSGRLPFPSGR
jgi:metal-dependent amidase/aminoacylase/carboxypeptidase family protein